MNSRLLTLIVTLFLFNFSIMAQNRPDVNLHFNFDLVNCPSNPTVSTNFFLSSADNGIWEVGFIMLTLRADEFVLGTPPQVINAPRGWNTDVYKQGNQWQVELVDPTGRGVRIGRNAQPVFSLWWPYKREGATFTVNIDDADLGVHNSLEDEQIHFPNGLQIRGSDDCSALTGEIDFFWYPPKLINCPYDPTLRTRVELASHFRGETWLNNFIQMELQFDNTVLDTPDVTNVQRGWMVDVYKQGPRWIIELTSNQNHLITDFKDHIFDIEWKYLREGDNYSITLTDFDLGLNVPNEIVHRRKGNRLFGRQNCPPHVKIMNVSSTCITPCVSIGKVYFDVDVQNGPGGPIEFVIGNSRKTLNLAAGDIFVLDESFDRVSFANGPQNLIAYLPGSGIGDTIPLPNVQCGPCNVQVDTVHVSSCDRKTDTYKIDIDVQARNLCNSLITASLDGGPVRSFVFNNNSRGTITIDNLPSDGNQHTLSITDPNVGPQCTSVTTFKAPSPCLSTSTHQVRDQQIDLGLFPNPVRKGGSVTLTADDLGSYGIYDLSGRMVQGGMKNSHSEEIDVSRLPKGIYMIQFTSETSAMTKRLIVE